MRQDDVTKLLTQLGLPDDLVTFAWITQAVQDGVRESRRLDFKRQLNGRDDLADDLSALANSGGGVLVIGIGVDRKTERASTIHPVDLKSVEQLAVQAAREGVDESLTVDVIPIPTSADPGKGFVVVAVHPSDRTPHISTGAGRVLHRVGTHNKPMTRREIGAAFASRGRSFSEEFSLATSRGPAEIIGRVEDDYDSSMIIILNRGGTTAFNVDIASAGEILQFDVTQASEGKSSKWINKKHYSRSPKFLPIAALPPGTEVAYKLKRLSGPNYGELLTFRWTDEAGQPHESHQTITWRWTGGSGRDS